MIDFYIFQIKPTNFIYYEDYLQFYSHTLRITLTFLVENLTPILNTIIDMYTFCQKPAI